MTIDAAISPFDLTQRLADFSPPVVLDVRRQPAFDADPSTIPGALRCVPERVAALASALEPWRPVVAYCVHGHEVGRDAAATLRQHGFEARHLEGGLEAWRAGGGATKPWQSPTRWVTRARPKIDRIACPWLIRRFLDSGAEIFYVPSGEVRAFAEARGATPFDVPDIRYTHAGTDCSFDAFIRIHRLEDPALRALATIVRGADTSAPHLAPEAPGLLAVSRGLSTLFADDPTMLKWGLLIYDALYTACRQATASVGARTPVAT